MSGFPDISDAEAFQRWRSATELLLPLVRKIARKAHVGAVFSIPFKAGTSVGRFARAFARSRFRASTKYAARDTDRGLGSQKTAPIASTCWLAARCSHRFQRRDDELEGV
ncbi:hypothetical protein [Paracoccus alkanivorans]|uniref:hypothetical protein n=1 Tax=Paracoccus alkanivorans TaxID=2116655 RepID=UPI0011C48412|nr:hypothetical protein [Paracoccus alkanivorans]